MKKQTAAVAKSAAKKMPKKRMVLYVRVSTEEQTKGSYPSCDSQVEELEAECRRRGWGSLPHHQKTRATPQARYAGRAFLNCAFW